ncbi:MAG: hypothetical protein ACK4U0_15625 [Mesorhizobium sp.]
MRAIGMTRNGMEKLIAIVAAAILALSSAVMAQGGGEPVFHSNGDLISGWYWLRDHVLGHTAEYTFANPPGTGDILVDIDALATDGINGGAGVDAVFNLLVGYPGSGMMGGLYHRIRVTLPNVSSPGEKPGYRTRGRVRLARDILDKVMPASGTLHIRIVRARASDPHVAFRADSVRLHADGGTNTELGDRGDEGNCFLDRPCIGDAAAEFRSTGWPGAGNWYWMRAPEAGQSAAYRFRKPPIDGDLIIDIAVRAQNQPGMTTKDTVHVNLSLSASGGSGGKVGPIAVALPSLWMGPDDDVWKARALVRLSRQHADRILAKGGDLVLRFERIDEFEPDVAFSKGSVLLYPAQDISR